MQEIRFPRVTNFFGPNLSISDFQHIQKLGKGTFGHVSLYKHTQTNEYYAIKRIQLEKDSKKSPPRQQLQMLTRKELQILYKIDNKHIIKLLDHFEDYEAVYLITEFIQGLNLYDQTLKTNTHLPFETVTQIIFQLCQGLEELHNNHIIHRDIKLENIMFNHDLVKIVDLGCSNFYADSIKRQTTIGTRLYWSPEVIAQEEQNDRLDIWCVGVVLYELVYLDQPFSGNDIQRKIRKCDYSFPNQKKPQPELQDLFRKIFTNKTNRISAGSLKQHAWIRKYRKQSQNTQYKFEHIFSQDQTNKYRELLRNGIASNNKFLEGLNSRSERIENWLKEARRQMKKK